MVGSAMVSRVLSTISTKNARQRAKRGTHAARREGYVRAGAGWMRAVMGGTSWCGSARSADRTMYEYRTMFEIIERCSMIAQDDDRHRGDGMAHMAGTAPRRTRTRTSPERDGRRR